VTLSTEVALAAITEHANAFAELAPGSLDLVVPSCPGWRGADLVEHVTSVHGFWTLVVAQSLQEPPPDPAPGPPESVVARSVAAAARLVETLGAADQRAAVWTWAPAQRDVAFITRHQVQEMVVHHWDLANAAGRSVRIDPVIAADAVSEFLSFSVSRDDGYLKGAAEPLGGTFALRATDIDAAWTIGPGRAPSATSFVEGADAELPGVAASAGELLLWLFGRVELAGDADAGLLSRFRSLCFTD
jgi:uncharacterized protein (TIGR03083 family)